MKQFFGLSLLCILLAQPFAHSTVYKQVQKDGSVIYTDVPQENAQPVEFSANTLNQAAALVSSSRVSNNSNSTNTLSTTHAVNNQYKLEILEPVNEATLRSNAGNLKVVGKLTPMFPGNYELFINGKAVAQSTQANFQLHNIDRGTLEIQIRATDNKGKLIASSSTTRVYLHRASVLNRAN